MKEAFVTGGPNVEIRDVPIPEPGPDQIVTKVVFSGSNPKDWYVLNGFDLTSFTHVF
jgi:NADPH2:quinone reductase